MASWWPTTLEGDPAACRALATRLSQMAAAVDEVARRVAGEVASPAWVGGASNSAALRVSAAVASAERLALRIRGLGQGVGRLADDLARLASDLSDARALAVSGGLAVTPAGFAAPPHHPAAEAVRRAREDEFRAHQALAGALRSVVEGPLLQRLVTSVAQGVLHVPARDGDLLADVSWLVGLPGAADLLSDNAKESSRAALARGMAVGLRSTSPHVVRAVEAIRRAGPAATRVARASGPVGNGLTVVTEGQKQWQADADDPRLSTADRVGRTATRATLGGAVALQGAFIGGQVGASIGSAVPVVGTAVGGVAGAAIGAFVASELGRSSIDAAVEGVDDVIDLGHDAVTAAGDVASDAADAVSDAAAAATKKLCFWD